MKISEDIKALAEQDGRKAIIGYKDATIEVKEVSDIELGKTIKIIGYLSTFNGTDRSNDTVLAGAFLDTLVNRQSKLPLLLNHERETKYQCGSFTAIEDDFGLLINADFLVTEKTIHEARLIASGHLVTLSMGGIFFYADDKDMLGRNVIEKVELLEGSIVVIPCNQDAIFTVAKKEQLAEPQPTPRVLTKAEKIGTIKNILRSKKNV
jgi:HK97 family phage prohead protease